MCALIMELSKCGMEPETSHKSAGPGISCKVQEGGRPSYDPDQPQAAEMDK